MVTRFTLLLFVLFLNALTPGREAPAQLRPTPGAFPVVLAGGDRQVSLIPLAPFCAEPHVDFVSRPGFGFWIDEMNCFQANAIMVDLPSESGLKRSEVPAALVDLIRVSLGEMVDSPESRLEFVDSNLLVANLPQAAGRIAGLLTYFEDRLAGRIDYTLAVFEGAAGKEPLCRIMDFDEGERVLRRIREGREGRILHLFHDSGRFYDRLFLGHRKVIRTQGDYDVEIAQEAVCNNPVVRSIELCRGVSLTAVPALVGNRVEVHGRWSWQGLACPVERVDIGVKPDEPRWIDRATIDNGQSTFSLGFERASAVLLSPGGECREGLRFLLLCRRTGAAVEAPAKIALFPTGLTSSKRLVFDNIINPRVFSSGTLGIRSSTDRFHNPRSLLAKRGASLMDSDTLVANFLHPLAKGDEGDVHQYQGFLAFTGPEEKVAKARQLVAALMQKSQRRFQVEVLVESCRVEGPGADWQPLGNPLVLPCLSCRSAFALAGREQELVVDYDTEVAQKAAISDPERHCVFDGLQFFCRVFPMGETCQVRFALFNSRVKAIHKLEPPEKYIGPIWKPEIDRVEWIRTYRMKPGQSRRLGHGPDLPDGRRTRLTLALHEY